jgi:hypothetical protein
VEVVDMLVRFPRNYYMCRFDKARPLYAIFSERKRIKITTRKSVITHGQKPSVGAKSRG